MVTKPKKAENKPTPIGEFILVNQEKIDRVINGIIGKNGQLVGGLGKDASEEAIIAEYDRIGGLIRNKDGQKIAIGSFYDFENKKPRTEYSIELAGQPIAQEKEIEISGPNEPQKKTRKIKKIKDED